MKSIQNFFKCDKCQLNVSRGKGHDRGKITVRNKGREKVQSLTFILGNFQKPLCKQPDDSDQRVELSMVVSPNNMQPCFQNAAYRLMGRHNGLDLKIYCRRTRKIVAIKFCQILAKIYELTL